MIYITGDTHGSFDLMKLSSKNFPAQKHMTKDDYVIILGDFGLVWNNSESELKWREWLNNKPFTTLFIDGNHDNHKLIWSYPECDMFGNKVNAISDSIFYLKRGEVYEIEGSTFLTIGGAESYDRYLRTPEVDWWHTETIEPLDIKRAVENAYKLDDPVDAVLSHEAPYNVLISAISPFIEQSFSALMLKDLWHQIDFSQWFCGHWHRDETAYDVHDRPFHFLYQSIKFFEKSF